ncbi:MAG: hypothetical protein A2Y63_03115 [Candidatus Riflebacteria bacterium RBG_13_59_9]|nr:MAG: hypothetical protein A2Y63_03115 [Candidatus Riflebacteria bacterium RBG_13_59_9]
MVQRLRVLFYCIGNACRSPMAEAICRHLGQGRLEVESAGVAPLGSISAGSLRALQTLGIDAEGLQCKGLTDVSASEFDLVISLDAGFPVKLVLGPEVAFRCEDWDIPDPIGGDDNSYREVARLLLQRIEDLLQREGVL